MANVKRGLCPLPSGGRHVASVSRAQEVEALDGVLQEHVAERIGGQHTAAAEDLADRRLAQLVDQRANVERAS